MPESEKSQPVDGAAKLPFNQPLDWHQQSWQHLIGLYRQDRLPHALLLSGRPGIGKLQFAKAFAAYLLCNEPGQFACGHCKGCRMAQLEAHPDWVDLMPDERGREIKVGQVRELASFISGSAQQGGYRVVIIRPPEDMNTNAANALLKNLEEPGVRTLFLLVSDSPGRLMPTVKSRCQTLDLPLPSQAQALNWLEQQTVLAEHALAENASSKQAPSEQTELLLKLCAGAPLLALELLRRDAATERKVLLDSLKAAVSGRMSIPEIAKKWQQQESLQLLEWLSTLLDDLVRLHLSGDPGRVLNSDAAGMIEKAVQRTTAPQVFAFSDKIRDYRRQLLAKSNLNKQLMYEDVLIGWVQLLN